MNPAEFVPVIPASGQPQTNALDHETTGIGIEDIQTQQLTAWLNKILEVA
jgi:hypothetical protein